MYDILVTIPDKRIGHDLGGIHPQLDIPVTVPDMTAVGNSPGQLIEIVEDKRPRLFRRQASASRRQYKHHRQAGSEYVSGRIHRLYIYNLFRGGK
jgi:hypothetical protein